MKRWGASALLSLAALVFGAPSLAYPFGRDQGLFFYVGREWALRGAVPYRDVLEQKTPFIYALHALLVRATGENTWAIRAAELLAIVGIGFCASRAITPGASPPDPRSGLATPGDKAAPRPGVMGMATLAAASMYYGYFSYQDTGNCEIWCALFVLASLACARSIGRDGVAGLLAGALFGLALLAKPPALAFAPALVAILVGRRRAIFLWALAGCVAVLGACAGYFAARGALGAMVDVVVRANAYATTHESAVGGPKDILVRLGGRAGWFFPFSYLLAAVPLALLVVAAVRRDSVTAARWALPMVLLVGAVTAVVMQLKFFPYYYGVLLAPFAVFVATAYDDVARLTEQSPRTRRALFAAFAVALPACGAFLVPRDVYRDPLVATISRARGKIDRDAFLATFNSPADFVDIVATTRVGDWIRSASSPDDTLLVRGYEPQIYAVARRHYTGRFFWSTFLTDPTRVYRRQEWLAEDRAELDRHPPAWVVAFADNDDPVESESAFRARGYEPRFRAGRFVVMQRGR